MDRPPISYKRPENLAELVSAYVQTPGVIVQKPLRVEVLRVPYAPFYNTLFILKRF
ncbi:hypothetical protein L873DRAFT_1802946 [Choiromyces venosus 120613-1]|uniref:Uncharacterized protein n=1 Tax=Choiromyces venosus 120613-1 TaxID=1336337 RepID=A0A3N4JTP4_9PEZI|nr:hypothetical protein L873DRAFT_1802946 [Choiromyces venosus 120613-1]